EVVEITTQEPAKKTTATIQDVKNMIAKTEKKINQVKNVVESDELKGIALTLKKMKNKLHGMLFKNGPGFEIVNKSEEPIWVTLVSGDDIQSNQKFNRDQIPPQEKLAFEIKNLKEDMKIAVYLNDPMAVEYTDATFIPTPDYLYKTTEGARGRTKYFTWNPEKHKQPAKYLYPQTGRLAGLAKVSHSKYSLSNNIKSFQLILTEKIEETK